MNISKTFDSTNNGVELCLLGVEFEFVLKEGRGQKGGKISLSLSLPLLFNSLIICSIVDNSDVIRLLIYQKETRFSSLCLPFSTCDFPHLNYSRDCGQF